MNNQAITRCPNCFGAGLETNCKFCGWQPGLGNPAPALALGVVLDGRYRIGRVLGHGGFGITYLAWDDNLHLQLAIKEYLPRDSATRAPDRMSLAIFSGAAEEQFAYGLDRFLEEARSLARYDQHPGIVTVKNFFRAHGTGYCVMEYVEGITLRRYLEQQPGGRISVADALKLLMPVADALKAVHKDGLLHRDIAPDNIYLTQDGRVKLLDFGAARFAAGEHSKSLSVILKPGYAPEEQYRARGKQGPWTDVYGLGATLYRAITGQVPPDSLDRLDQDELVPPSRLGVVITPEQEAILLKAMMVKVEQRHKCVAEFQDGWCTGDVITPYQLAVKEEIKTIPSPEFTSSDGGKCRKSAIRRVLDALVVILAALGLLGLIFFIYSIPKDEESEYLERAELLNNFKKRAEEGDATSQWILGYYYSRPDSYDYIVAKDDAEAVRWFRKAAEQGHQFAQNDLGKMYRDGTGIAKDEAEAVRWFRKAAEQDNEFGQLQLGQMYRDGRGIAKDDAEAIRWFRKAAEQGNADALNELGVMYSNGAGVKQDNAEAIKLFRQGSEQGNAACQNSLGVMYEHGHGVQKDLKEAKRWYLKAAVQGNTYAKAALERLGK